MNAIRTFAHCSATRSASAEMVHVGLAEPPVTLSRIPVAPSIEARSTAMSRACPPSFASEGSATVSGKRNGNVKVALNSNQVKSLQAGIHADGGGLYLVVRESGDRVWAFRFTDLEGRFDLGKLLRGPLRERRIVRDKIIPYFSSGLSVYRHKTSQVSINAAL